MKLKIIKNYIEENSIDAKLIEHQGDGLTSENAAKVHNTNLNQIVKVLLFIDKKKNKAIIIAQGDKRINTKLIPGLKKPRIASIDELNEFLDCEPGGVPPICLPDEIPKFIDENLQTVDEVIGSGGSRFTGLKIKVKEIINHNKNIKWTKLTPSP